VSFARSDELVFSGILLRVHCCFPGNVCGLSPARERNCPSGRRARWCVTRSGRHPFGGAFRRSTKRHPGGAPERRFERHRNASGGQRLGCDSPRNRSSSRAVISA
jgi:hypothetical protein